MEEAAPARRGRRGPVSESAERILVATAEVLARRGTTKLSVSEVAAQAALSRMTVYRFFPSKEELIAAFTAYETEQLEAALGAVTKGLDGVDRLDATLRFLVDYQLSYSGARMLDVEPGAVLEQMNEIMPTIRRRLAKVIPGPDAELTAASLIRIVISHYAVNGDDADQFLAQLRHVAGIRLSFAADRPTAEASRLRRKGAETGS
ncbi:TetR/AcrR family transcriptional regulator [Mycobacterium intracellulare]|uniref:TetR/AcrR family transcriptional regulator n=1 Tax=Mycobacterium intracellulare TaxID=1767 RepID=UPI0009F3E706|nr:TetR/AcrR family transcriptional regulator [Mycobacterium intracellulare]